MQIQNISNKVNFQKYTQNFDSVQLRVATDNALKQHELYQENYQKNITYADGATSGDKYVERYLLPELKKLRETFKDNENKHLTLDLDKTTIIAVTKYPNGGSTSYFSIGSGNFNQFTRNIYAKANIK